MSPNTTRFLAILTAIAAAAALRLVPHPPNFTPVGALALFSGAFLGRRALAFAAPIGAMLVSDAIIGFHSAMPFVYAGVAATVLLGQFALSRLTALRVAGVAILGSVLFFALTNFGVWLQSGMYPPTLAGLAACYVAAIPFFQYSLAGDLLFTGLLFGGFALAERAAPALRSGARPSPA